MTAAKDGSGDGRLGMDNLALRLQLVVGAALVTLGLVLTASHAEKLRDALTDAYRARGLASAQGLSAGAAPAIELRDVARAQRTVEDALKAGGLAYAYVTDERGEVLARATVPGVPAELTMPKSGEAVSQRERDVDAGDVHAIEVTVPMAAGRLSAARVGVDRRAIDDRVSGVWTFSSAVVIALLVVVLAAVRAYVQHLIEPIRKLTKTANEIATSGDLTIAITAEGNGEVAALAKAVVAVVERLRAIATSVQTALADIDQSVNSFSAVSMQQATALQRQAAALTETNTTTQEIKQTSAISATKAEEVLEIARRAEDVATRGRASVDSSAAGMQEVQEQVKAITLRIRGLIEKTLAVSEITDTVGDLAEQSNVLAINAAIEAVKAGEAGRGFGVVAREIRGLADQSMQATARVRALIAEIQRAIHGTVLIIEEGNQRVDAGLSQVHSSGESLRDLAETVRDTSRAAKEIARSVSQQNVGIEQIFSALMDLDRLMNESVLGIEDVAAGGEAVRQVSSKLRTLAGAYRV